MSKKTMLGIAAVVAAAGALLAGPAQARVALSIGVPIAPAPVYSYGYPQPVYAQPYYYPQPAYVAPQPYVTIAPSYGYGYGYGYRRGWRDSDHDGVPNRFDHRPFNPHRR